MEIELPDGSIAEFPDGTPPETIKAALQKRFPPKQATAKPRTGLMDILGSSADPFVGPAVRALSNPTTSRQLGLTGRYMLEGPANLATTVIGDPANALVNMGIQGVNKVAGTQIEPPQNPSEMVGPILNAAGLPQPENAQERVIGEASKFVTSIPAFAGAGAALTKAGVPGLQTLSQNMGQQLAGGAVGGLAYGGTKEITDNPLLQVLAGVGGGLAGSGAVAALSNRAARQAIPSADAIKQMANQSYKASEAAGAIIKPEAVQRLMASVTDDLAQQAYIPLNAPKVAGVLGEIERISQGNVTLKGLDALRQAARDVANSTDAAEARLGLRMIDKIDDLVLSLKPADIVQGQSDDAVNALLKARSLWGNSRKAQLIDDAIESAGLRAASTGSGGNVENAIRQNLRRIIDNPKLRKGFSKSELAEIKNVVTGSNTQNLLRLVGKLSPQGSGLMAALGIGATAANPAMAVVPAGGAAAKFLADVMTRSGAAKLSQNIRGSVTGTLPQGTTLSQRGAQLLPLGGQMNLAPGLMQLLGRPAATNAIANGNQEK